MNTADRLLRLMTRATLNAAPDTLATADDVAAVMGIGRDKVRAARSRIEHGHLGGSRAVFARWSSWRAALEEEFDAEGALSATRGAARERDQPVWR